MPTTWSRSWAIPLALSWWRRQTYAGPLELVVVASGEDRGRVVGLVVELLHDLPPAQSVRQVVTASVPGSPTLGAKHNLACGLATHPWLAKWDDDDWQAPRRLERTMNAAVLMGAEVASSAPCFYHDLEAGKSYRYAYPGRLPWVWGNSLLFSRALWERHRFDDTRGRGIDTAWIWGALGPFQGGPRVDCAAVVDDAGPLCVAMMHGPSTGRSWRVGDMPEFEDIDTPELGLGADLPAIEEAYRCSSRA